jgi:hypothetical protein
MSPTIRNQAKLAGVALAAAVALAAPVDVAFAQSGHFLDRTVRCVDTGTQVACTGKVAGLGGTTFTITIEAEGTASIQCRNPGGNVAPGQDTTITATGSSGPLATPQNGQFVFSLSTIAPSVPNTPTCPNASWTAEVVDVTFGDATLSLFEDDTLSDDITVPVQ